MKKYMEKGGLWLIIASGYHPYSNKGLFYILFKTTVLIPLKSTL